MHFSISYESLTTSLSIEVCKINKKVFNFCHNCRDEHEIPLYFIVILDELVQFRDLFIKLQVAEQHGEVLSHKLLQLLENLPMVTNSTPVNTRGKFKISIRDYKYKYTLLFAITAMLTFPTWVFIQ